MSHGGVKREQTIERVSTEHRKGTKKEVQDFTDRNSCQKVPGKGTVARKQLEKEQLQESTWKRNSCKNASGKEARAESCKKRKKSCLKMDCMDEEQLQKDRYGYLRGKAGGK